MAWKKTFGRQNKFGQKRVEHRGYSFASKLEAAVFSILKLRQDAGEIFDLKVQQRVYLVRDPDIYYIPDFSYLENGELVYAEAKGLEMPEWKLKKKLWVHFVPYRLEIWKGSYTRPRLDEIILPRNCNIQP